MSSRATLITGDTSESAHSPHACIRPIGQPR